MTSEINATALATCVGLRWSPQIGDPTVAGWVTVVIYFGCACLSLITASRAQDRREWIFWGVLALAMLSLGVNKQLDLQSMLTAVGRCVSKLQGWYEERRSFQRNFIVLLLIGSSLFLASVLWLMRGCLLRNGLAIIGLAIVASFVSVRAVGFHHVDALINSRLLDIRYNVLFELSGLVLIAANAIALLAAGRARHKTAH